MNVLGLVPARGGSKGIPRKNLAPLGGRPLIAWTIETARQVAQLTRLVVSTDDDEIAAAAAAAGAEVPFRRPAALATDTAAALPVIRHAVEALDASGWQADAVVYLQPTSPFRTAGAIRRAIALLAQGDSDTAVSVVPVPHAMTPESLMRPAGDFIEFVAPPDARLFRRQDKPPLYARNGPAVLALTRTTILRNELYGPRVKAVEMGRLESYDIDEPIDLVIADALVPLVAAERAAGRL
jgi:CMP-N,N'-diacetyllegionaminic acid synthase